MWTVEALRKVMNCLVSDKGKNFLSFFLSFFLASLLQGLFIHSNSINGSNVIIYFIQFGPFFPRGYESNSLLKISFTL